MKRLLPTVISLVCMVFPAFSQEARKVSATYIFYAPESMSVEEAKRIALEKAKIQAIADEFGTTVAQSSSSIIANADSTSVNHFSSVGGTDVKGEWVETIGEPIMDISFDNRLVVVTCRIEGYAIEKRGYAIDYSFKTLRNAPNLKYESDEFNSKDDLYVYFTSPVSGYMNIFLLDYEADTSYCLLPYKNSKSESYRVDADQEYYFFSEETKAEGDENVDEYVLSASNSKEFNDIVVIFSPQQFGKPSLSKEKKETVPRKTSINKFNKWIAKLKTSSDNISISNHTITISNSNND